MCYFEDCMNYNFDYCPMNYAKNHAPYFVFSGKREERKKEIYFIGKLHFEVIELQLSHECTKMVAFTNERLSDERFCV